MEGFAKGDSALGGVDQGTRKIIKEIDHEIPNIQASTPTLSNDREVRDVPFPKNFVNTLEEGTNTFLFIPKMFIANCLRFPAK